MRKPPPHRRPRDPFRKAQRAPQIRQPGPSPLKAEMDHDCAKELKAAFANSGTDVTVGSLPPLIHSEWTEQWTCPHGTKFWTEPTGEQHAKWAAEEEP